MVAAEGAAPCRALAWACLVAAEEAEVPLAAVPVAQVAPEAAVEGRALVVLVAVLTQDCGAVVEAVVSAAAVVEPELVLVVAAVEPVSA